MKKNNDTIRPVKDKTSLGFLMLHPQPVTIRRERIEIYQRHANALKRAHEILRRTHETDLPAYQQWYASEFVKEHERLASLHRRYEDLEMMEHATEE